MQRTVASESWLCERLSADRSARGRDACHARDPNHQIVYQSRPSSKQSGHEHPCTPAGLPGSLKGKWKQCRVETIPWTGPGRPSAAGRKAASLANCKRMPQTSCSRNGSLADVNRQSRVAWPVTVLGRFLCSSPVGRRRRHSGSADHSLPDGDSAWPVNMAG